ncbi:MAG: molybdopterin-dependent oxidoreductase [bacterium]|nr:molybdopterin dinucleotide-binding protein [Deltaproteobacteria bacterium]MCP4908007.1 molybdopterin-dependent oxidoreductase [bacterium]
MTDSTNKIRTRAVCRNCMISCGVFMEIEDGRVVGLIGDKDDPASHGYTCARGRDVTTQLYGPNRLLRPLRKAPSGDFESTSPETAISEIADRLRVLVDEHGPASVALYTGTYALAPPASLLAGAFMNALGSPMSFSCGSIDQPGKFLARALHGQWQGGGQPFATAETWLFVGTNPLVSGLGGIPTLNPAWHLNRALKRGIKLIVIDPRRSETAKKALLHLQPVPGEDAAVLAGMVRIVLEEGLFDKNFVDENTRNLEVLRQHVESFTPEFVERRADVPATDLLEATRVFASSVTGGANAGTGANFSSRGTLTEYLLACLVTLCGFRAREGDLDPNPGVLVPRGPRRAQPLAPTPAWGFPPKLRTRGLSNTACGLPTSALADEILLEGEGQIRALICLGGNPLMSWPDQAKTRAALERLDLLVVLDPKQTQTGQFADYVMPPKLVPEIPALSYDFEELESHAPGWGYALPYAAYREALVDPPDGSELLEDWELFYLLAREMELDLQLYVGAIRTPGDPPARRVALDMQNTPTTDELFDVLTEGSRIPLSEVRRHHAGQVYEDPNAQVLARDPDSQGFLELGDEVMLAQLDEALESGSLEGDDEFPFRLICRRQENTLNSLGRDQPKLVRARPHHPAHMHPADMQDIGIAPGAIVAITSRRDTVHAVVMESEDLRRGLVSMSHSYGIDLERLATGSDPGEPQPFSMGNHTGALASADLDYEEPYTGLPRLSSIPVRVTL